MNKASKAVALKWREDLPAPLLVAKGEGALADAMIRLAIENGVEITEDPLLPSLLAEGRLMDFIPIELYEAVAKVLAKVYNLSVEDDHEPAH